MRIAVFGATGETGGLILEQAAQRGWTPVAFTRGDPLAGVQTWSGDIFDVAAVAEGLRGCDAVLSVLGFRRRLGGPRSTEVYSRSAQTFVEAMPVAGIARLVFCTSAGVEEHDPNDLWAHDHIVRPLWLKPAYDDMARAEEIISASDLQWVLVRPGHLTEQGRSGSLAVSPRFRPGNTLPRSVLATFMLDQVTSDQWLHQTPTLAVTTDPTR